MPWKKNKRWLEEGFPDLQYVPRERSGWDCTLASLAFGVRRQIARRAPDLNAWAVRHGLRASLRSQQLGAQALVLWHGTSRPRAEKIREHGLFHKRGLWTTLDPWIAHSYCRGRSGAFSVAGAVVCIVLDRDLLVEGRDYTAESSGEILRFHGGLPAEVIEYVLLGEGIEFTGEAHARQPAPWLVGQFKRQDGRWVPAQKAPVRYSDDESYSTLNNFLCLSLDRLIAELGEITALEVFSTLYSLVRPRDALRHQEILELIEQRCVPGRRHAVGQTFRGRA